LQHLHGSSISFVFIRTHTHTGDAVPLLRKSFPLRKKNVRKKNESQGTYTSGEIRTLGSVPLFRSLDLDSAISISDIGSLWIGDLKKKKIQQKTTKPFCFFRLRLALCCCPIINFNFFNFFLLNNCMFYFHFVFDFHGSGNFRFFCGCHLEENVDVEQRRKHKLTDRE